MTQQEFEQRTGIETNASAFERIHAIYMAAGERVSKDTFCKAYKAKTDEIWFILHEMANTINSQENEIKAYRIANDQTADFLIEQSEKYSSEELRNKVIDMLGEMEYLRRKIMKGYNLWQADRELLNDILKQ